MARHAIPRRGRTVLLIALAGLSGSLMALSGERRDWAGLAAGVLLGVLTLCLC